MAIRYIGPAGARCLVFESDRTSLNNSTEEIGELPLWNGVDRLSFTVTPLAPEQSSESSSSSPGAGAGESSSAIGAALSGFAIDGKTHPADAWVPLFADADFEGGVVPAQDPAGLIVVVTDAEPHRVGVGEVSLVLLNVKGLYAIRLRASSAEQVDVIVRGSGAMY